jgi:two-component system, OmpR family, sensor kinase
MRLRPSPYIRTRLAAWFILIVVVVLATFSVAVYQLTRYNSLGEVQRDVRQRATLLAAAAAANHGEVPAQALDTEGAPDVFAQIVDASGTVQRSSASLAGRRLPFSAATVGTGQVQEVRLGEVPLYVSGRRLLADGRVRGYVLVARSPRSVYLALSRLRRVLYPGTALALALAGGAGWLLTRRAMRPLEHLDRTAAQIAATGDHARRLRHRGPHDEIGRLAATIDGMLASLEDAHRQVQAANKAQRRFLADVSHELRTPLTIMLSSLDLLARVGTSDPEFNQTTLQDMRAEVTRMARMVSQLLIMARSDADAAIAYQPVLLADVVADACRREWANGAGGRAAGLIDRGLGAIGEAVVRGNPDYLEQLFLILLDNAAKYTPPSGCIQVRGHLDPPGAPERVAVTVADTGIGISANDLPHIFDRFYRAESARAHARDGMGLGLAIARHIAEQHGGRIHVESTLGHGASFTVTLPLLSPG